MIPLNEWTQISAKLACGCYARSYVYVTEALVAEDILNRYGATFWFDTGGHDQSHAALCRDTAPPISGEFWLDSVSELGHSYPGEDGISCES